MDVFINLTYPIFNEHPTISFSKNMQVPVAFWSDLWRRHALLDYSLTDIQEWYKLKTGKEISEKTIRRYIVKQELFNKAQGMIRRGETTVHIRYFPKYQEYLKPYVIVAKLT